MGEGSGESVWERGDYGIVGDWFADASRACLGAVSYTHLTLPTTPYV